MDGRQRIIIENVQPVVDSGRYPAKRTVGERVDVTASIFGDGHDHVRARVSYRKEPSTEWSVVQMTPGYNDDWTGSFHVTEKGKYLFKVSAWIDHFETWHDGFLKKAAAKIDVKLELMEGALMLRTMGESDSSLIAHARRLED